MRSALIVSPHLDDAVLSCGQFLAGRPDVIVATVFAGIPEDTITTAYDRKCGFELSHEAMATRRREDEVAVMLLGGQHVHLPHLDDQYQLYDSRGGEPPENQVATVAKSLRNVVRKFRPEFIVGPVGIQHPDHEVVRDAVLTLDEDVPLYLYEELPYRVNTPELVAPVLAGIHERTGRTLELTFIGDGPLDRKLQALWCYRTQMHLPEFANPALFTVPERFWHVAS